TTAANELLFGAIAVEGTGETMTAGAGYTALTSVESAVGTGTRRFENFPEYRLNAPIGTYVANGTLSSGTPKWTAALVTYSPNWGNGVVNAGEQCDDGNTTDGDCCDHNCHFEAAGTVCRLSTAACDAAETCTGASATCPADALSPSGTVCRSAAGACDVAET